jgi:carboxymethylenebutenolidase
VQDGTAQRTAQKVMDPSYPCLGSIRRAGRTERRGNGMSDMVHDLGAVFDEHVRHEFVDHDVEATMSTMIAEPYVWNVPTAIGGVGGEGVRRFYSEQFIGKMPADTEVVPLSRTVGVDQVVDEVVLTFTHDCEIPFMLPDVPPTGRHVRLPHAVVMRFENGKIAHEHIYWDQASLLAQVGLLDPAALPAIGGEQASKLFEVAQRHGG